jgi:hypothetical protein
MAQLKPTKTVYTVSDFLDWQRNGSLELKPIFQRREVWNPKAKSLLIDSVVKGLPMPIIFLRKTQDLKKLSSRLEVVDGQQRLRTLFSFLDPTVLLDYNPEKDDFTVLSIHNAEIADRPFRKLPKETQADILGYEISTHVLPPESADEIVLRIFARLNSTGAKLNHQELRNAQFFGNFKTLSYDLAIRNLPLWRRWGVFDDEDFARMVEVETTSDLLASIMQGLQGKSQPKLDALYKKYDDSLEGAASLATRFQRVMDAIDEAVGQTLGSSRLRRQALFYSLFTACYDHMYGLGSKYTQRKTPKPLPHDLAAHFKTVDARIAASKLPESVQDAMDKATADKGRRTTRHTFFMENLGLAAAK